MRILLTTDTVGGVWTFTKELTEQHLRNGHSVALVSFGRFPSHDQQAWCVQMLSEHEKDFIYECSETPLEWMQENAVAYEHGAKLIANVSRRFHPHIIHSNQLCFGRMPVGVPTLVTVHSDVLSWAAACKPQGLESSPWLQRYVEMVQAGLESADLVTTPTEWMRNELCRHFHVPCRIEVIANGLSLEPNTERSAEEVRAVSVGRLWDEAKGLRTLTEIDSPIPISVAGEEQFENASHQVANPKLKFFGKLNQEQLVTLFCQSSNYIATS